MVIFFGFRVQDRSNSEGSSPLQDLGFRIDPLLMEAPLFRIEGIACSPRSSGFRV
jgi:hypothetical protein